MIVLDDNLDAQDVLGPLKRRVRGKVVFLRLLRPGTVIKDEAVPAILRRHRGATFVTTNVTDFWRRMPAAPQYCILCLPLPNERQAEIPEMVGRLFRHPAFTTRASRMGKVAQVTDAGIEWYEGDGVLVQATGWRWGDTRR